MKTVFKGARVPVEVTLHPQRSYVKMDRLLCALIILFLAAFSAPSTNAEDEKISSNEDLGINNDDPVEDDEDLFKGMSTEEIKTGSNLNSYAVPQIYLVWLYFFAFQIRCKLVVYCRYSSFCCCFLSSINLIFAFAVSYPHN